jgi:hypothetical protein
MAPDLGLGTYLVSNHDSSRYLIGYPTSENNSVVKTIATLADFELDYYVRHIDLEHTFLIQVLDESLLMRHFVVLFVRILAFHGDRRFREYAYVPEPC